MRHASYSKRCTHARNEKQSTEIEREKNMIKPTLKLHIWFFADTQKTKRAISYQRYKLR